MTNPVDSLGTGGGSSYYPNQDYLSTGGAPGHLETYTQPSEDIDTYIPPQGKTSTEGFIGNLFKSLLSGFLYILSGPSGCTPAGPQIGKRYYPPNVSSPKPSPIESKERSEFDTVAGIEVPQGSENRYEGESYVVIQISENFVYQGIPVSAGEVYFHKSNKQIKRFTLSEDFDLSFKIEEKEYSVPLTGGQRITLYKNGIPMFIVLYQEWEFNGDQFASGSGVKLNETGQLTFGKAKPGTIIQGYPIGNEYPIYRNTDPLHYKFHENGKLKVFVLGEDFTVQGINFKKGTEIYLDEQGRLDLVMIKEKHTIFGKNYDPSTRIFFDDKGKVSSIDTSTFGYVIIGL